MSTESERFWNHAQGGRRGIRSPSDQWLAENVRDGWDMDLPLGSAGAWSYAVSRIDVVREGMRVVVRERFDGSMDEFITLDRMRLSPGEFEHRGSPPPELWRFGVEYEDGTRITTVDALWLRRTRHHDPADVVIDELWASADIHQFWFAPTPPAGRMVFGVEWPLVGLPFSTTAIDLTSLDSAAKTPVVWPRRGIRLVRARR